MQTRRAEIFALGLPVSILGLRWDWQPRNANVDLHYVGRPADVTNGKESRLALLSVTEGNVGRSWQGFWEIHHRFDQTLGADAQKGAGEGATDVHVAPYV